MKAMIMLKKKHRCRSLAHRLLECTSPPSCTCMVVETQEAAIQSVRSPTCNSSFHCSLQRYDWADLATSWENKKGARYDACIDDDHIYWTLPILVSTNIWCQCRTENLLCNLTQKKGYAIVYGKVHMSFSAFSRELLRNGYVANENEGLQCL